ncbi:stonustoxin subunit beta-like, partial [Seriola lalandi dorsalis]|uniref:stonustoxin subunit beta-like n=1 Tax=Seriola lalandi dorsalis TaxID=1841481 RepID=UPI000C6F81D4
MASSGDDTLETAALGRPFQLGTLYDCRKDVLVPGVTLWDPDQLQKNTSVQHQHNTEFNVTASDSIEEKSNLLNISGSLKLSLLGGLVNVGGSAKYFQDTTAVERFSCTFHGDFKLPSNPTSFNEAVSVYRNLPNMLGENGEHAVPLRVWLYPLVRLNSRAARLQRDISNSLITYSSETIESLNQTEMRCSDILKDAAATTFPAVEKKVQDLMQMCKRYKLDFMQKLGKVLPSIRGGGKEESALADILKAHEKSPFNNKDLEQWLKTKGRESDTLKSFL